MKPKKVAQKGSAKSVAYLLTGAGRWGWVEGISIYMYTKIVYLRPCFCATLS